MKKRSANVDCARFIAAMLIMANHINNTGVGEYPFHEAWIYVEFFLLITGYYTAKHYSRVNANNRSKDAFQYTIKKFMPLFPYAFIATICGWVTQGVVGIIYSEWTWKNFVINLMGDFTFDVLLISDSFSHPLIVPLWYVSAMIIVFPFFCLLVQIKNRYTKVLISIIYPLMYFGWIGVTGNRTFPHNMLRVLAGMMLGLLLYEFSMIFEEYIRKTPKSVITLIELLAFAYPIYCCYRNFAERGFTTTRLYLLCYFISLLLCLPGFSYTEKIKGSFLNYLGRLSMPIFILHWYFGTLVNLFGNKYGWEGNRRIAIYYVVTICVSTVLMFIIEHLKKWNDFLKRDFEFID